MLCVGDVGHMIKQVPEPRRPLTGSLAHQLHLLCVGVVAQQLKQVLANQGHYITQTLGRPVQLGLPSPTCAAWIVQSTEQIGSDDTACSFDVLVKHQTL